MKKMISLVIVLSMLVSGVIINTYATTITLNTTLKEITRKSSVVDIPIWQATSVFNYAPANSDELKQVHRADALLPNEENAAINAEDGAKGRFEVVALYFAALKAFDPKNPDVTYAMMEELCESPTTKILNLDSFNDFNRNTMKDSLSKSYKYKYVGNAYFNGAEPSNGYTPIEPLTVTLEDYVHSSQYSDQYQTWIYTISSFIAGADCERIIEVYQDSVDGKWYIFSDSWMGCTADIKDPALEYLAQWQSEPTLSYDFLYKTNNNNAEITGYKGKDTKIEIPREINGCIVTSIAQQAFEGCTGIESVFIPDSVESIGKEAFVDCKNLTSVTIGSGCKSIDSKAFWDCPNLKKITIQYPNCIFNESQYTISTTAVICGYNNSTAYYYARTYMRLFEDIETRVRYGWIDGNFIEIGIVDEPTTEPTTEPPTYEPTEAQSTNEPTTETPTYEPTEAQSTVEPTTEISTNEPTEVQPTTEPTTVPPTTDSTEVQPTDEPTTEPLTTESAEVEPTAETTTETPTKVQPTTDTVKVPDTTATQAVTQSTTSTTYKPTVKPASKPKPNTLTVSVNKATVKAKKLKKKSQKVKPLTVKNAVGKVSFKIKKAPKKLKKLVKINNKGVITIKKWKKAKKGDYKIKVKITAAGNKDYLPLTLTKTVNLKIK